MTTIREIRGQYEDVPFRTWVEEPRVVPKKVIPAPVQTRPTPIAPMSSNLDIPPPNYNDDVVDISRDDGYCNKKRKNAFWLIWILGMLSSTIYFSVLSSSHPDKYVCTDIEGWKKYTNVIYFNRTFDGELVYYEFIADNMVESMIVHQKNNSRFGRLNNVKILYSWVKNGVFDTKYPYTKKGMF